MLALGADATTCPGIVHTTRTLCGNNTCCVFFSFNDRSFFRSLQLLRLGSRLSGIAQLALSIVELRILFNSVLRRRGQHILVSIWNLLERHFEVALELLRLNIFFSISLTVLNIFLESVLCIGLTLDKFGFNGDSVCQNWWWLRQDCRWLKIIAAFVAATQILRVIWSRAWSREISGLLTAKVCNLLLLRLILDDGEIVLMNREYVVLRALRNNWLF